MIAFKAEMDNFNKIVNDRVAKLLKTNQIDLQNKVEDQQQTIAKLNEHNKMQEERIVYLEEQLKSTRDDLIDKTRASIAFTSGFQSKGPQFRNRNFEQLEDDTEIFDRNEEEIDCELA